MGEAYFLRAHYYYILVRLYGGVPLRLQPFEPGQSTDIARNTVDEVYAQILSDCKNAVDMLPQRAVTEKMTRDVPAKRRRWLCWQIFT